MKTTVLTCTLLALLTSCITINENGYRLLTKKEKSNLVQFSFISTNSNKNSLIEITGKDVTNAFSKVKYTWVHVWIPYCKAKTCRPLYYYDNILANSKTDMQLLTISQIYDTKQPTEDYNKNIYVIKDSVYGHGMRKSRTAFTNEITHDKTIAIQMPSHMIFKGNKLIYYSDDMTQHTMDSVIAINQ